MLLDDISPLASIRDGGTALLLGEYPSNRPESTGASNSLRGIGKADDVHRLYWPLSAPTIAAAWPESGQGGGLDHAEREARPSAPSCLARLYRPRRHFVGRTRAGRHRRQAAAGRREG